jgi:4-alpha-glucanotransferase
MNPFARRRAGVLLHITSLPGPGPNGDLGEAAYHFVDWLSQAGITVWQLLPHGPTHSDGSPYQCLSVHAGNEGWISTALLRKEGWLQDDEAVATTEILRRALAGFRAHANAVAQQAYTDFCTTHRAWLDDYVLFAALREEQGNVAWTAWPAPLRDRDAAALAAARKRLGDALEPRCFAQFLFYRQWHALKQYANERGVLLFGDLPIYVALDSADVWANREQFDVDATGRPATVAGVPPDYFSATGQRWGNPHYDWARMKRDGFQWWVRRFASCFDLYDMVRVDHFRGFEAYWSIPADAETAVEGQWVQAPGAALFTVLQKHFGALPVVAEDLGIITAEVTALRQQFGLPGMKILQFAFDSGGANLYLPHNHEPLSVVYTGTHDNDTTRGWFEKLDAAQREDVLAYLGYPAEPMPWPLIRAAFASVAQLAVVPWQDLLALGTEHRMNTPGTATGNWAWRFDWVQCPHQLASRTRDMLARYGRLDGD